MNLAIYDPMPFANEYASRMFIEPVRQYAAHLRIPWAVFFEDMPSIKNKTVVICTDHLNEERIQMLKNNGNRIIGFNVTDSSYISQGIRYAPSLPLIDHIFMLSGIQKVNVVSDFHMTPDFGIVEFDVPFLDEESWKVFQSLDVAKKLHSLPYVLWNKLPEARREPWTRRSQKAILRGGGHIRRFLLALHLMTKDRLDPNSGFVLHPYFADDMNQQFRYCKDCRDDYKQHQYARQLPVSEDCNSPARNSPRAAEFDMFDLGQWNNRCPRSFFWFAKEFSKRYGAVDMNIVGRMLNARWLSPQEHMDMLGRILFTSDLKWIHSIYHPQRFWEGAHMGCISVLPERTETQESFPNLLPGRNYLTFKEDFTELDTAFSISESDYNAMAGENRFLYEHWMRQDRFPISDNLLKHIFEIMT